MNYLWFFSRIIFCFFCHLLLCLRSGKFSMCMKFYFLGEISKNEFSMNFFVENCFIFDFYYFFSGSLSKKKNIFANKYIKKKNLILKFDKKNFSRFFLSGNIFEFYRFVFYYRFYYFLLILQSKKNTYANKHIQNLIFNFKF